MKTKGNGRAKILTQAELDRLFERGFVTPRDKLLFAVTYYCACRVSEALSLTAQDLDKGVVTLRKSTTKGKTATRTLPMHPKLNQYLEASTHSFRRTALTNMSNRNVPIRVIQQISGHSSLTALQRYLEVKPEQVTAAISLLI